MGIMTTEAIGGEFQQREHFRSATDITTDVVVRRRITLWEPTPVKNKTLMDLYRYWEALRPDGFLPNRADFDMDKLRPIMGMASVVDVDCNDPMDYRIRLQGSRLPLKSDHSKHAISDIASVAYQEMLAIDYRAAKEIGTPAYHEIAARLDYLTHSYARLILPFAKDGRRVDQLYVCSILVKFPDLLEALH
jgi:hypothetical protein